MSKLSIGLAQLNSNDSVSRNLNQIIELIRSLNSPVDIVFFPENSLFFRINEAESVQYLNYASKEFTQLAELCVRKKMAIHLGSVALNIGGQPTNSSVVITSAGKVIKTYSKLHLFDIQLNNDKAIKESDSFRPGEHPSIFNFKGWRFGQSICYDIRFSELYRYYNSKSVDVLLIPAAFLKKTGEVHWHILNRARAIENQAFVVSSAQVGPHMSEQSGIPPRETYGHSLCISPWGSILTEIISTTPAIKVIELDKDSIANVKKQIPMDSHRFLNSAAWKADEISLD